MMYGDNKEDLQRFCNFTLSHGNIAVTLAVDEAFWVIPTSCRTAPWSHRLHPGYNVRPPELWAVTYPSQTGLSNKTGVARTCFLSLARSKLRLCSANHRRIKDLYQVEINTKETGDDERRFIITGAAKDPEKVLKIIKDIAKDTEDYDREQESRSQYKNAPNPDTIAKKIPVNCRFFARGKCNRGNTCKFEHTHGPSDSLKAQNPQ